VRYADGARQVAGEDEPAAEDGREQELPTLEVPRDLRPELGDPRGERVPGEEDLPDAVGRGLGSLSVSAD
jgi:hypothetical protein